MEQVFEICKCAEDDKVKFAMCTFEGRALTWWNGNVQTLGLANANQIPWSNVKAMMTTEYCPATETKKWSKSSGLDSNGNLSGHMLQPQLEEGFMLEIYQSAIDATYIIMDRVLKGARNVKNWVTKRRIVDSGSRVQVITSCKIMTMLRRGEKGPPQGTSFQKQGTSNDELVLELM
ncbi:hypothetical protein Tco_1448169 [Tanacetum coccineum]|uniref:Retrotransposon gag domain-containing protein n=1 Tax=Tanacetum coccineum TaxID=301880 RepID=A0ABQ5I6H9_9ASTR